MIITISFAISLFIIVISLISVFNIRLLTYITIISIFFPIHIPFMGRDAMTTGTVCIFLLFFKYLIVSFNERSFIKEKFDLCIYLLIILGAISIIFPYWTGVLEKEQIGPAVRLFFGFFGATLLFLVIKNYREDKSQSNSELYTDHIENLLSLFLLLVSLHVLLSIAVKFSPGFGSVFKPFLARDIEVFDIFGRDELERLNSFIFSYEIYGEILAVLSPLVLYKIFRFGNPIWIIYFLLFALGEIFTVTRSGIILFVIGMVSSLLYHFREKLGKALVFTCTLLVSLVFLIYLNPSLFGDVILRFSDLAETYKSGGTAIETINRADVFIPAWDLTVSNLAFFGNGVTDFHFHNLFLTTLHQKGIIGATFFFVVLLYPALRLIKSLNRETSANKALIFSCLLSMALFLINEIKFEFTRHASYQQICWGLFATYYRVSKTPLCTKKSKRNTLKRVVGVASI